MTNTKFRKRALLSSVAMLLVALVALGSATFAWFSTKQAADATGLSGGTTKASSLVIKEEWADDWANSIEFDATTADVTTSLTPVTFNGTTWKTGTAAGYDLGYRGDALSEVSVSNTYAAYTTVYVKYGEAADPAVAEKDLTVKVTPKSDTSVDALKFVRVAIVPAVDNTNAPTKLSNAAKILGSDKNDFAKNPDSYSAANMTASASTTAVDALYSDAALNLGNMTNGTAYLFNIYVYYEGTDKDCIDSNAGLSVDDFKFDFGVTDHA